MSSSVPSNSSDKIVSNNLIGKVLVSAKEKPKVIGIAASFPIALVKQVIIAAIIPLALVEIHYRHIKENVRIIKNGGDDAWLKAENTFLSRKICTLLSLNQKQKTLVGRVVAFAAIVLNGLSSSLTLGIVAPVLMAVSIFYIPVSTYKIAKEVYQHRQFLDHAEEA